MRVAHHRSLKLLVSIDHEGRYLLSFDGFTGDVDELDAVTKFLEDRLALIRSSRLKRLK